MADSEVRKNKSGGGTAPAEVLASSSEQTGTGSLEQENGTVFAVNLAMLWVGVQGEEGVNWRTQLEHYDGNPGIPGENFPISTYLGLPSYSLQANDRFCFYFFDVALFLDANLAPHLGNFPLLFIYSPNLLPPTHYCFQVKSRLLPLVPGTLPSPPQQNLHGSKFCFVRLVTWALNLNHSISKIGHNHKEKSKAKQHRHTLPNAIFVLGSAANYPHLSSLCLVWNGLRSNLNFG